MKSLYVTFDRIEPSSGAGKVCIHEVNALRKASSELQVIERSTIDLDRFYQFNPFLWDYFAAQKVEGEVDFAELSCSPGLAILSKAHPKKYVVDLYAHDLKTSIEEHERLYGAGTYPFIHNTDPYLHKVHLAHAEKADAIITPSRRSAEWVLNNTSNKNVKIIPHGCDPPARVKPLPEKLKAGYMGAWGPDKGNIYLLMALKYLSGEIEIDFAGPCSQVLPSWINSMCLPISASLKINIMGWVKDVGEFYNGISVYVQPSVTEGFGLEVLEAMSYGRPVIVTDTTGASDLVEDGREGFVIPCRNPKAIRDKIEYFVANPSEAARMGANARVKAQEHTWEKNEEKLVEMYREVME